MVTWPAVAHSRARKVDLAEGRAENGPRYPDEDGADDAAVCEGAESPFMCPSGRRQTFATDLRFARGLPSNQGFTGLRAKAGSDVEFATPTERGSGENGRSQSCAGAGWSCAARIGQCSQQWAQPLRGTVQLLEWAAYSQ
jgi:hypothetical protein